LDLSAEYTFLIVNFLILASFAIWMG